MKRPFYLIAGLLSLALGGIGVVLPLLPTVPFVILAAFCFANSSPRLEKWLLEHKTFGPHIVNWRKQRAITRKGKWAAVIAFAFSIALALLFVRFPWNMIPVAAALIGGTWIWTRAEPTPKLASETQPENDRDQPD